MYHSLKTIFNKLEDDVSRQIFMRRLAYYLDGRSEHLQGILSDILARKDSVLMSHALDSPRISMSELKERVHERGEGVILYGAGNIFPHWVRFLRMADIPISSAVDRNPMLYGKVIEGVTVAPIKQTLEAFPDCPIMVTPYFYYKEIADYLLELGLCGELIYFFQNDQYFAPFICLKNEIYLQAGAYDGGDIIRFNVWSDGTYRKIIAIEPDSLSMLKLKKNIGSMRDVEIVHMGVYDKRAELTLDNRASASAVSADGAGQKIKVVPIDEIVQDEIPTLISMDSEGSELKALYGAKRTIRHGRPRLAICVYHKPEYLLTLVPEYKFLLRHHIVSGDIETVLYAFIE